MQCLNIGCGQRFHPKWINIDKVPRHPSVRQCDVEQGLFFPDCHFDVVYHSHVLEHFEVDNAKKFIAECYRILKPKGVLRVAVPDLEQIVQCYLQILRKITDGDIAAQEDYNWIMLELYDQVVRNSSGGQMAAFLSREVISNRDFIVKRCGVEVQNLMRHFESQRIDKQNKAASEAVSSNHLFSLQLKNIFRNFRELIIKCLLGSEYNSLKIGRFRCSGENHQWMYDKFSLHKILSESGFVNIIQRAADKSFFSGWSAFNLDTDSDGSIYKPDSLYMEALKP
ncbi:MAG: methyltransferase domain-containing protein [Candidatus Electrothrix sp. ATG1]|nr:methyltransferase domain-containing protein [Candidatus Electrothrix sp. ATG1]